MIKISFPAFPFGPAPLALLVMAVGSGLAVLGLSFGQQKPRADLVFMTFAKNHLEAYQRVIPAFEREHGVTVNLQLVDYSTITTRLQAAMTARAALPDLVEIGNPSMGTFTSGPLSDVGFVDLTERVHALRGLLPNRLSPWSSRGRLFALPHDVHPVVLTYRRDLVEQLGIDVATLQTWDDFSRVGREVTKDLDGDGNPDRYMIDLPTDGQWGLSTLMLQAGGEFFDRSGRVCFDSPATARVVKWYVQQVTGPQRIAFAAGWGQNLNRCATDGLALFYLTPDWRCNVFREEMPHLAGKMAVMPLPAWEPNGRRTSTWGGSGLCLTKNTPNQELAWKLAMALYLEPRGVAERFKDSLIIPPVPTVWNEPEFAEVIPFFGQPLGSIFISLAPSVPETYVTAYSDLAATKLNDAFSRIQQKATTNEAELDALIVRELTVAADYVRVRMARNRFLNPEPSSGAQVTP